MRIILRKIIKINTRNRSWIYEGICHFCTLGILLVRISIVKFESPKNTTTYMHYYLKKSNLLTHYRNVQNQTIIGILEYHTPNVPLVLYLNTVTKITTSRVKLTCLATVKHLNICYRILK